MEEVGAFGAEALDKGFSEAVSEADALAKYLEQVKHDGDFLNDWLTHLSSDLASSLADYFKFVVFSGDALNDYLQQVPENVRKMVYEVGLALAEGAAAVEDFNANLPSGGGGGGGGSGGAPGPPSTPGMGPGGAPGPGAGGGPPGVLMAGDVFTSLQQTLLGHLFENMGFAKGLDMSLWNIPNIILRMNMGYSSHMQLRDVLKAALPLTWGGLIEVQVPEIANASTGSLLGRLRAHGLAFEHGGEFVVDRPTIFAAGEAYRPERVRVEPVGAGAPGGEMIVNGGIHVSIDAGKSDLRDPAEQRRVARSMVSLIREEMRR